MLLCKPTVAHTRCCGYALLTPKGIAVTECVAIATTLLNLDNSGTC